MLYGPPRARWGEGGMSGDARGKAHQQKREQRSNRGSRPGHFHRMNLHAQLAQQAEQDELQCNVERGVGDVGRGGGGGNAGGHRQLGGASNEAHQKRVRVWMRVLVCVC